MQLPTPTYGFLYEYYPISETSLEPYHDIDFEDLKLVKNLPENVQLMVLRSCNNFNCIKHLKNLTEEACIYALTSIKSPDGQITTCIGDIPLSIREKPEFLISAIDAYEKKIVIDNESGFNEHISFYFRSCDKLEESILTVLAKRDPIGFVKYLNKIATEQAILVAIKTNSRAGIYLGEDYTGGFQRGKEIWEKIAGLSLTIDDESLKSFYDDMYTKHNIKKFNTEQIEDIREVLVLLHPKIKSGIQDGIFGTDTINYLSGSLHQISSKLRGIICSECDKEKLVNILTDIITDINNLNLVPGTEETQV